MNDPHLQAQVLTPVYDPERCAAETWNEVHYQPIEGRLIGFPGWIEHETQPNPSPVEGPERDRISISFSLSQQAVGDRRRCAVIWIPKPSGTPLLQTGLRSATHPIGECR